MDWDSRAGRVSARKELRVGTLIIESRQLDGGRTEAVTQAVCSAAPKYGLTMFDFNDDVQRLQIRVATVADWHPELALPSVDTGTLLATAGDWLPMYIGEPRPSRSCARLICVPLYGGYWDMRTSRLLSVWLLSHLRLPGGRNARIDYRRGRMRR